MSSLVSDFIINPVLRQARRFSEISRSTFGGDGDGMEQSPTILESEAVSDNEPEVEQLPDLIAAFDASGSRPQSSSTEETSVEDLTDASERLNVTPHDHLGFPISPSRPKGPIPEDDGMRSLRGRIHQINSQDISADEKARLMHNLLSEGYVISKKVTRRVDGEASSGSPPQIWRSASSFANSESSRFGNTKNGSSQEEEETFILRETDILPTYAPIRQPRTPSNEAFAPSAPSTPPNTQPPHGCQHYERKVKIECSTCKKWYTCVFCHDEKEDHSLIRKDTKHMLCMLCATPQKPWDTCINCNESMARYYCDTCKLWENRASKPVYHCEDCGICRRGLGLGKDFFHCKTCRACITTSIESSHKCIERSTDCDCPICGEYMFTSPKPVVFMKCGHSIHRKCYEAHLKVSYKCPICSKSLVNMESQFRNLEIMINTQPMPTEFRDTKATILCNDCSAKSTVPYHWLGLKCSICRSYNTAQLQLLGRDNHEMGPEEERQIAEVPTSAAARQAISIQGSVLNTPITSRSRTGSRAASRRRHSSHGAAEHAHGIPDRVARSLSPVAVESYILSRLGEESDEDDENEGEFNMFRFWRRGGSSDGEDEENSDSDGSDDRYDDDDNDDDGDDDDQEDDNMFLIGHR